MPLKDFLLTLKGRGNFGHAGRPGKRGGSAPNRIQSVRNSIVNDLDYNSEKSDSLSKLRKVILTAPTMSSFRKEFENDNNLLNDFDKIVSPSSTTLYKGSDKTEFNVGEIVDFKIPTFASRDESQASFYGKGKILVFPKGSNSLKLGFTDESEKAELLRGKFEVASIEDDYIFLK